MEKQAFSLLKKYNFYGFALSEFTRDEIWEEIDSVIKTKSQAVVHWKSLGTPWLVKQTPGLLEKINEFDIILVDGRGLFMLMKLKRKAPAFELYTSWFTLQLLEKAAKNNYSVMILGATEEVNKTASLKIKTDFGVKTVYPGINGYFSEEDEAKIIEKINEFAPDILLIGISTPKKELFAHRNRERLNVRIIHLCGGMVDVIAGKTKITPKLIKRLGFAWLYRLLQEPRRLLIPILSMLLESLKFSLKALLTKDN
ncbi:MAG: WecB/TagA/CpsF family glycosyltransferase [Ignavibacteriales bacterium]|nr:MAG: WecB/TagA/CpsF family glycosyltransferase [Ignavibacteriaceae bacterium]MBZ0197819.1 WecB/TagA/CpsF family glycosyltransferase [Ignavibacteriaceae bacterium]MCZ2142059.1 WecB/TagA/CpsF family glycosyltransferase [Ignavibacteriales bacterium]OQY71745.1 MAG: hypothetical protein B6D45_09735 [Ignavibacteriales bacterium UTCHB3]WKZ71747.1 MAG: WecB/TagA/CpsF family glycosyltransferase [Ignavibacteriaceae bacterium]